MIHPTALALSLVCMVSQAPDPWWKWTFQSVIPVAGGTLIAVWSFVQNRKTEEQQWNRNQHAAHEQWILDQKKAEWRELLKVTSDIENAIPAVSKLQDRYDSVSQDLPKMLSLLLGTRGSCIFIAEVLDRQDVADEFDKFVRTAAGAAEFLQGFNASIETDPGVRESCRNKYLEIREAYLHFHLWLKTEARKSLGIITPAS